MLIYFGLKIVLSYSHDYFTLLAEGQRIKDKNESTIRSYLVFILLAKRSIFYQRSGLFSKIRCKITAFLAHTQLFLTKNATNLCKNVTKNRLYGLPPQKKRTRRCVF